MKLLRAGFTDNGRMWIIYAHTFPRVWKVHFLFIFVIIAKEKCTEWFGLAEKYLRYSHFYWLPLYNYEKRDDEVTLLISRHNNAYWCLLFAVGDYLISFALWSLWCLRKSRPQFSPHFFLFHLKSIFSQIFNESVIYLLLIIKFLHWTFQLFPKIVTRSEIWQRRTNIDHDVGWKFTIRLPLINCDRL